MKQNRFEFHGRNMIGILQQLKNCWNRCIWKSYIIFSTLKPGVWKIGPRFSFFLAPHILFFYRQFLSAKVKSIIIFWIRSSSTSVLVPVEPSSPFLFLVLPQFASTASFSLLRFQDFICVEVEFAMMRIKAEKFWRIDGIRILAAWMPCKRSSSRPWRPLRFSLFKRKKMKFSWFKFEGRKIVRDKSVLLKFFFCFNDCPHTLNIN